MNGDRELLEAAARAAGYMLAKSVWQPGCLFIHDGKHENRLWNPLDDDGDALRLAVKLGLVVDCLVPEWAGPPARFTMVLYGPRIKGKLTDRVQEEHGDPYAATRRAIVRAAAAIGSTIAAQASEGT